MTSQLYVSTTQAAAESGRSPGWFVQLMRTKGFRPAGRSPDGDLLWRVEDVAALPLSRQQVSQQQHLQPAPPALRSRRCRDCHGSFPAEAFGWDGRGEAARCEACRKRRNREYMRKHRAEKPESIRARNLWRMYRMRIEDYDRLRERQGFACAICGIHEGDIDRSKIGGRKRRDGSLAPQSTLQVDHCHRTDVIRGLLCPDCNRGLGAFLDDPVRLRAAAAYAEEWMGRGPICDLS